MDKKKLAFIIIGTLLAMALVATALVLWLVPGDTKGAGDDATQPTGSAVVGDDSGEEGGDTKPDTNEPTVGVEVEIPGETTGSSGNSGNSGNGGNSGNSGNSGNQGGNNEIDFDDLLGNG